MNLKCLHRKGLSVVEILVVIAILFVLVAIFLPISTNERSATRARRISCVSNLKQVGLAARLYANDHDEQFPWMVSTNFNPTNTSGSREFTNSPQVFLHFLAMSNELNTPKILHCPSDEKRERGTNFATLSNRNLSYFISFEADERDPNRFLSGDRNITGGSPSNGFLRVFTPTTMAGWTTELHNLAGNVGLSDGSVQQVNVQRLQNQVSMQTRNFRIAVP
jgi:competence protein ComGC